MIDPSIDLRSVGPAVGTRFPDVRLPDQSGDVVDKRFYQSYRERETGVGLLEDALHLASPRHGAEDRESVAAVQIQAHLDSVTFAYYQRLRLTVKLTIPAGFHVYGPPVPEGYVPLSIEVSPIDGLVVGEARWPPSHPFRIAGLDEEFWVYDGVVRGSLPLTFALPPGSGDQTIRMGVAFQSCDATTCLVPTRVSLSLPVEETGLVDRPLRR